LYKEGDNFEDSISTVEELRYEGQYNENHADKDYVFEKNHYLINSNDVYGVIQKKITK
jgi:hypothetical protein